MLENMMCWDRNHIKKKREVLYLSLSKANQRYEQIPTININSHFKTLEGYKIDFFRIEDGTMSEVKMIQP
jgi:hypothetical protein